MPTEQTRRTILIKVEVTETARFHFIGCAGCLERLLNETDNSREFADEIGLRPIRVKEVAEVVSVESYC